MLESVKNNDPGQYFGIILGAKVTRGPLVARKRVLGVRWGRFVKPTKLQHGSPWAPLGRNWAVLGTKLGCLGVVEASWRHFGRILTLQVIFCLRLIILIVFCIDFDRFGLHFFKAEK